MRQDEAIVDTRPVRAIRVNAADTVAVTLSDLEKGENIDVTGRSIRIAEPIPAFHKFALEPVAVGDCVIRFGQPIGEATRAISVGQHVHSHNLKTRLSGTLDYVYEQIPVPAMQAAPDATFRGYRRADGRVGTRNEIWVIATVGCVANVCDQIVRRSERQLDDEVDGVVAITHPFGCSQLGDDLVGTRDILAGLARHPNAGGIVLVALGCESNQVDDLLAASGHIDRSRVRIVRSQAEADEIEAGVEAVMELVETASADRRETCDLSDLVIGLKCGGSDAMSGLTANPLLGRVTDDVTAVGGSAVLTEIPEVFGAEHLLMARAANEDVFRRTVDLVNGFKDYFLDHRQPVFENPSPGNKAGGITTLEEKSLGAVQKAGSATLTDVIRYGERVRKPGLTLLEAPGNDAVSCTALAAAGCNLILFTTGRGTPLGFPVPTVKVASNSALAARKPGWIDFNAGQLIDGTDADATKKRFLQELATIASGKQAGNELNGERSIAIWKRGVTL